MPDQPEYHDGLPVMPPARAQEVTDKLRIQIIGVRAGWSAWAASQAEEAGAVSPEAADERWGELMDAHEALRRAELALETAIEHIAKEDAP